MTADPAKLRLLADLLDDDHVNDVVMGALSDALEGTPHRDAGAIVEDVLSALRGAA